MAVPSRTFFGKKQWSDYASFSRQAFSAANSLLSEYGLKKGECVAVIMENCPEYLEVLYAIWCAGLIAVPVNAKLHPKEFEYILQNCEAKVCITSLELSKTIQQIQPNLPFLETNLVVDD